VKEVVQVAAVIAALLSAAAWYRAATVKVTREQVVEARKKAALKKGEIPNLAGVTLDGADLSGTFAAQSKWNSVGAIGAAVTVLLQAFTPFFASGA
jgi:hypothetical protein